ncbi:TIGR03576 family pyridoxal phosphate-dependent enzyme [Methanothermococcus sp.]|uniref:TIGR03576 family pyridoxal phosphate-dependent enzyme n=1 Tax=Methanothermococcus sp. TaxID=2614238 RepID=UPI0025D67C87|nr:TIGR03576 family pyridoxal phosphate-dependent enzyme [Methanothermococcus sp.]
MNDTSELNRLEKARTSIRSIIKEKGRNHLYDLTGIAGGFKIFKTDLELLETYVGPAIFSEKLNEVGILHFGGDPTIHKAVGFNRTSAAIFSTIMALSNTVKNVIHYVPKKPSHPSIPRSCKIFNLDYFESDNVDEILNKINKKTLTIITGATMDHKIIDLENLKKIISYCNEKNSTVFIDDASGARLRLLYNQPPALELNADLAVTSTDKLMEGPRAGLLCGKKELVNKIYGEGLKFGLEAQAPILAAMVNALKNFKLDNLKEALKRAENIDLSPLVNAGFECEKTPTGFIIKNLSEEKYIDIALKMLENYGIITITAAGMPGASKTLRIDFCSKDAKRITDDYIINAIINSK